MYFCVDLNLNGVMKIYGWINPFIIKNNVATLEFSGLARSAYKLKSIRLRVHVIGGKKTLQLECFKNNII